MRVLVTGARGYVGSVVVAYLAKDVLEVNEVDAGWFSHADVSGRDLSSLYATDFRALDIDSMRGVDVVIHLAGYSNDPLGWLSPQQTYDLNETATVRFAERAKLAGVSRFVFSSTCSVYGEADDVARDEMGVTSPVTPYGAAKLAAETALLGLRDASFGVAILRGATAFGPSPVPRTDLLLNELCAEAACGRPLELQSDGQSWRPFMPVGDFARALCTAALQTPQDGADLPVWNIAPPQMQMTVRTAAERAAAVAQTLPPRLGPQSAPDRRSYRVSGARFVQAYPDFTYSDDFDGMIASTIRAFKAIPTLAQDLRADRFVRLAQLKRAQLAKSA